MGSFLKIVGEWGKATLILSLPIASQMSPILPSFPTHTKPHFAGTAHTHNYIHRHIQTQGIQVVHLQHISIPKSGGKSWTGAWGQNTLLQDGVL